MEEVVGTLWRVQKKVLTKNGNKTHASVTLKQKLVNYNLMDIDTERGEEGENV